MFFGLFKRSKDKNYDWIDKGEMRKRLLINGIRKINSRPIDEQPKSKRRKR